MQRDRLFAVIPAAGESRRMGRPKLLLDIGGRSMIARLLTVMDRLEIAERVIVIRPGDEPLRAEAAASGAKVVEPTTPPSQMRESVQLALTYVEQRHAPRPDEGWLLVPGDYPLISSAVLDHLLQAWQERRPRILIPTLSGRRGHPVFFRWELAAQLPAIPPDRGLNWILEQLRSDVLEFPVGDPAVLVDVDTPEEYKSAQQHVLRPDSPADPTQE